MIVRFYESSDLWEFEKYNYEKWNPELNHYNILGINLSIVIGFSGEEETKDIFTLLVVHESDFCKEVIDSSTPVWIVRGDFSWGKVYNAIENFVASCNQGAIDEKFLRLRKRMNWEFEGRENVPHVNKEMLTWIALE